MKKKVIYLFLQLGTSLSLFLLITLLILSLRSKEIQNYKMPNVTNKNFIDVYNTLQKLELHISISKREYPKLEVGLILSQGIEAGETIQANDKLHLVVNQPKPYLKMPNINYTNYKDAVSILKHLPAYKKIYSLQIKQINTVETRKYPHNTIIAQFPPAGARVNTNEPIYLLLALHPGKDIMANNQISNWKGKNITLLASYFKALGIDYRIKNFIKPSKKDQIGLIQSIKQVKKNQYAVSVYYEDLEKTHQAKYQRYSVELSGKGNCQIKSYSLNSKEDSPETLLFFTSKHKEDEEIELLFFLHESMRLETYCGNQRIDKQTFYSKVLS